MLVLLFLYFIATKQHNSSVSLLSSVNQKHWMVGECLEQLFGGKIQENISDFSVNVYIHSKSHCPFLARETVTGDPVSPKLRLALCLYRLGRGDYLYTIAPQTSAYCVLQEQRTRLLFFPRHFLRIQSSTHGNYLKTSGMFKENCNIAKKSFYQVFTPKRENTLSLDSFLLGSFASLVLRAPENNVFKTTISYLNDKIDRILASLQCMPYPFSKLKGPIYFASLHCFQQT